MNIYQILPIVTVIASIASVVCAWATFRRAGRWKESDEGKALIDRVGKIETAMIRSGVKLEAGERLETRMLEIERRMTTVETDLKHVASRGDVQEVKAELTGLDQAVRATAAAVTRIETFLMEQSRTGA